MKFRLSRVFIIAMLGFVANTASSTEIIHSGLVGKWRAEKTHASGAIIAVEIELLAGRTFMGKATVYCGFRDQC